MRQAAKAITGLREAPPAAVDVQRSAVLKLNDKSTQVLEIKAAVSIIEKYIFLFYANQIN